MANFSLFKLPLVIFFLHGESCSSWCRGNFNLFLTYLFDFFINLKDVCVNVVYGNAQVLNEELNLLWLGFLGMVFDMLLAFHINLIESKYYTQHTYAIFLFFINFSNILSVSMCSGYNVKRITIYFLTNYWYKWQVERR